MRYRIVHIALLIVCSFALTGCRDMFYHEVDFKVEGEREQLVLQSRLRLNEPVRAVIRHTFVLDPSSPASSPGYVPDAAVSFRINSGAWMPMAVSADTSYYSYAGTGTAPILGPLDTVRIMASHPVYGDISAMQIMPDTVRASVPSCEIEERYGWVRLTMHLDPYHGHTDDKIGIVVHDGEIVLRHRKTGEVIHLPIELLYSTDPIFAQLRNLSTDGYYGAIMSSRVGSETMYYPLFLSGGEVREGKDISFFLDARVTDRYQDISNYSISLANTSIGIYGMTSEAYNNELFKRTYMGVYLPSPSGIPGSSYNYVDQVLQALSSVLGRQEAISPYTNVSGGLGYFTGQSFIEIPF